MHGKPEFNLIRLSSGQWQLFYSVPLDRFIHTETIKCDTLDSATLIIFTTQRLWEINQIGKK